MAPDLAMDPGESPSFSYVLMAACYHNAFRVKKGSYNMILTLERCSPTDDEKRAHARALTPSRAAGLNADYVWLDGVDLSKLG